MFLDDEELLHIALDGFPSEYDSFSYAIRTRSDVLFVEELNILLNSEERVIKKRSKANVVDPNLVAMAMNFQSQNQGFPRGRGGRKNNKRGRGGHGYNANGGHNFGGYGNSGYNPNFGVYGNLGYNPNSSSQYNQSKSQGGQDQSNRPICQICGKNGHIVVDCYHRMDFLYQGKHARAKLASMVANFSQV